MKKDRQYRINETWGRKRLLTDDEIKVIDETIYELGLKKSYVAAKAGMSIATLSNTMAKRRLTSDKEVEKIAKILNLITDNN
jgi:transcriptional regulator with XRE-family HTH domain